MTSQAVEGTWIRTGGYGWFRGEQVKLFSEAIILHFFRFHSFPLHAPVGVLIIISFFSGVHQITINDANETFLIF